MKFDDWLQSFSWLHERDRQCIVSADLDGVACALLQSINLGWSTVGTYDAERLALYVSKDDVDWANVVFIDVEILRPQVHSIGNHLFAVDADDVAHLRSEFPHCASPNLWRGINVKDSFQRKYPFSTLPLLIAAQAVRDSNFRLHRFWLALTLHTDSSFTNAAMYQANALDWLAAMDTDGRSPGLDSMCRRLKRMPGQSMVALLHEVQTWAGKAGFGALQRACRFDPRYEEQNKRIGDLTKRLENELGEKAMLPFGKMPVYVEEFKVQTHPNHTVGRRKRAFKMARDERIISMAATGRTENGLRMTFPNADSPIACFR